jgi:hypothetical protein
MQHLKHPIAFSYCEEVEPHTSFSHLLPRFRDHYNVPRLLPVQACLFVQNHFKSIAPHAFVQEHHRELHQKMGNETQQRKAKMKPTTTLKDHGRSHSQREKQNHRRNDLMVIKRNTHGHFSITISQQHEKQEILSPIFHHAVKCS